jgi:hypothetical protein
MADYPNADRLNDQLDSQMSYGLTDVYMTIILKYEQMAAIS